MAKKKGGLGRGFDILRSDNSIEEGGAEIIAISQIEPNRNQPRKEFDTESLSELADSISEMGVIQPLIVRPLTDGGYQIVAGERRWRASKLAGLTEVPVIIRDLTDREVDEIALVENLQRENLNPIEEAEGYARLMQEYDMTQEQVSQRVGKARSTVANSVRLLDLPTAIRNMLSAGKLTVGHARPLLGLNNEEEAERIASLVDVRGLTVRDVERMVRNQKKREEEGASSPADSQKSAKKRDHYIEEVELALQETLRRRVKISVSGEGRGTLEIEYFSLEELGEMAMRIAGEKK